MDKPTLIFFGNERLATGVSTNAPTLQAILTAGYPVAAIVSHHTESRSRNNRDLEIAAVAAAHSIPVLLPEKPAEIADQLKAYGAEAAVLVAYGKIIPQSVIDIFPKGIVNIHPSLLPLHRGPIPIESVILDGSKQTGVSIMQLVREMDAGPVYGQVPFDLTGTETKQELADILLQRGGELLIELLPGILHDTLLPEPQDDTAATYDELITKDKGLLDFNKPAQQSEREIRAYHGWPQSRTIIADKEVVITNAHTIDGAGTAGSVWREGKRFGFYTTSDILEIDTLKPAGKQEMPASAFLAGYGSLL